MTISLVDKETTRFERIDFNFARSSTLGKMFQTTLHVTEKSLVKGRVHGCGKIYCGLILRNFHSHPNLPPDQSAATNTEARPSTSQKITAL